MGVVTTDKAKFIEFLAKFKNADLSIAFGDAEKVLKTVKSRLKSVSTELTEFFDVSTWDEQYLKLAKKLGLIQTWKVAGAKIARLSDWLIKMLNKVDFTEIEEILHGVLGLVGRYFKG